MSLFACEPSPGTHTAAHGQALTHVTFLSPQPAGQRTRRPDLAKKYTIYYIHVICSYTVTYSSLFPGLPLIFVWAPLHALKQAQTRTLYHCSLSEAMSSLALRTSAPAGPCCSSRPKTASPGVPLLRLGPVRRPVGRLITINAAASNEQAGENGLQAAAPCPSAVLHT